jgi:ORF6N domain
MSDPPIVTIDAVSEMIVNVRGSRVMLDADLAALYAVETRILLRAVRRHPDRFPPDFMLSLSVDEVAILRSQFGISRSWGGRRYAHYAFTELGVAMLSSVLNSPHAVQVNIDVMRAFVRLRGILAEYDELTARLDALEERYDEQFKNVFDALRALIAPPPAPQRTLGFREEPAEYTV